MDMHDNISENAHYWDEKLFSLAFYQETKGQTVMPVEHESVMDRFSDFKGCVRRGEFTVEQLEERVLGRYGITNPIPSPPIDLMMQQHVDKVSKLRNEMSRNDEEIKDLEKQKKNLFKQAIITAVVYTSIVIIIGIGIGLFF